VTAPTNDAAKRLRQTLLEDGWMPGSLAMNQLDEALAAEGRATMERIDARLGLSALRDYGYQPMYNGRPSCPFCDNFVDDEETHTTTCPLIAILGSRS
jgi:hypothetical protein